MIALIAQAAPWTLELGNVSQWGILATLVAILLRIGGKQKQAEIDTGRLDKVGNALDRLTGSIDGLRNDLTKHSAECDTKHDAHAARLKQLEAKGHHRCADGD